jgi:hypothetical protein
MGLIAQEERDEINFIQGVQKKSTVLVAHDCDSPLQVTTTKNNLH